MGLGGISIWQLLIILVIVVMIFGTKRIKGIGSDLGAAVKGFRSAMTEGESEKQEEEPKKLEETSAQRVAEGEAALKEKEKL
jgi:sec-independent protein translocase protein TatA